MAGRTRDEQLPHGRMLSAAEAEKYLGISASTVRTWYQRRERTRLYEAALDRYRRPLFYEADLLALKLGLRVRDNQGHRNHTMRDIQRMMISVPRLQAEAPRARRSDPGLTLTGRI